VISAKAARYLDLASLGQNAWWRYALALPVVAVFWLVLGYVPYALIARAELAADPLVDFVAINLSIFMMLAGLALAMRFLHRRPMRSLVTPETRIDWRRVARGAAVWLVISVVVTAGEQLLYPGRYYLSFDPARFFVSLALVLALTPLQGASEELLFRGYAMQGLARLTRRPAVLAVASSLLFALPHLLNPEVRQYGLLIMGANYFAIGMLLATITLRDGRLELAIGVHAANNVFLALAANYEGSVLMTESLFTARELDPWYSLAAMIAGTLVFHAWVFRRAPQPGS